LIATIHELPVVNTLIRMKTLVPNDNLAKLAEIQKEIDEQLQKLEVEYL
jgi:predicted aldo/keto reductase-like oxidoreductase